MLKAMPRIAITAAPGQPRPAPLLLFGDVADAFRQAAGFGCQGVEIHMRQAEDVDVRLVKRLMSDYGLGVPTLGTGMAAGDGLSLSHADAEVRARTVERVRGHIDFAAQVGSAVTIGSLSGRLGACEAEARRERRSRALESLTEVCVLAMRVGVTVLLEPLNRYECDYLNTLADGMQAASEIGAQNLKLLADTFHMNIEEADMPASLKAAGSRVGHVHLADTNRQAPGHGHLDVTAILRTLDEIGYQGYLSFELLPLPTPGQAIRDGMEAIHAAIQTEQTIEPGDRQS
jgi:sugar phosphate isomerase/epimerase